MFKRNAKKNSKVHAEPFDDTGEIQVVPIDTVVGDGGCDLEADPDDAGRNQVQGRGARGKYKHRPDCHTHGLGTNPNPFVPRFQEQGYKHVQHTTVEGTRHRGLTSTPTTSETIVYY